MQKKNPARKQQPRKNKSVRSGKKKNTRVTIGTTTIVVAFAFVFIVATTLFYALHYQSESSSNNAPGFYQLRKDLNNGLRNAMELMGIDPGRRSVIESRDKMLDQQYSWYILNWKIIVDKDFDFEFAKNQLERIIYDNEGEFETYYNPEDSTIPLKLEAYVNSRLSHRIFFTLNSGQDVESRKSVIPSVAQATQELQQRQQTLSPKVERLDRQIQQVFMNSAMQSLPMMIYERWSGDYRIWVVNVENNISLYDISKMIRDSINVPGFWFEENFEYQNKALFALDFYVDSVKTHTVLFSGYPVAKGLQLSKKAAERAVYISPPKIAIIIDDIGRNTAIANQIMDLPAPVTLSILPHMSFSQEIAIRAFNRNHEFLLHLPMEPGNPAISPGVGGIYVNQDNDTKRSLTLENIDAIPNVIGTNNHMGSKATSDPVTMSVVLDTLKSRGMFFIDSRTSAKTVAFSMARESGIPTAERQIFLDTSDGPDYEFSRKQLRLLLQKAKIQGSCVAIGHPFSETIAAIESFIPEFRRQGVELVFASQVVTKF